MVFYAKGENIAGIIVREVKKRRREEMECYAMESIPIATYYSLN